MKTLDINMNIKEGKGSVGEDRRDQAGAKNDGPGTAELCPPWPLLGFPVIKS